MVPRGCLQLWQGCPEKQRKTPNGWEGERGKDGREGRAGLEFFHLAPYTLETKVTWFVSMALLETTVVLVVKKAQVMPIPEGDLVTRARYSSGYARRSKVALPGVKSWVRFFGEWIDFTKPVFRPVRWRRSESHPTSWGCCEN